MKTLWIGLATGWLAVILAAYTIAPGAGAAAAKLNAEENTPMLAHMVYFTLNESTPAARQKLVEACNQYLSDHPGTVYYGCGTVADYDREVNDRDFDVSLHVVFEDRAAHDKYQVAPAHLKFIEENKATWKNVRVFDSDLQK